MDVEAIQEGLALAVKPVPGIRQAFAALPDAINPPTWGCVEVEVDYDQTFGPVANRLVEAVFSCGIFTSRGDDRAGRKWLSDLLSSGAIKSAIEADLTLGGRAKALRVERVKGAYRLYPIAGIDYLGATFDIRVWS